MMHKRIYVLCFFAVLFLLNAVVYAQEDPNLLFDQGIEAFNANKFEEAVTLWEQALRIYKSNKDDEHIAMVLNNLGLVKYYTKQYPRAIDYFKSALAIDRKREIKRDIASDLANLGLSYYAWGKYSEAISAFVESTTLYGELIEPELEAQGYYQIGIAYATLKDYENAIKYLSVAAEYHRNLRNREAYANDLLALGDSLSGIGRIDTSMELLKEALLVYEALDDQPGYIAVLIKTAMILKDNGRYVDAIKYLDDAEKRAQKQKDITLEGKILMVKGEVYDSSGDYERAFESYVSSFEILKKNNELRSLVTVETDLAILQSELLRFKDAHDNFQQARLIYQVLGEDVDEGRVISNLGKISFEMEKYDDAHNYFMRADEVFRRTEREIPRAVNLLWIGEALVKKGEWDRARETFTEAYAILKGKSNEVFESRALAFLGVIAYHEGNYSESYNDFTSALSLFRKKGSKSREADILVGAGLALIKMEKYEVARGYFGEALRIADSLNIEPIAWRATFAEGLLLEKNGETEKALVRFEDALYRSSEVPEISSDLLGARLVSTAELFEKLRQIYGTNNLSERISFIDQREKAVNEMHAIVRFGGLAPSDDFGADSPGMALMNRYLETVGAVNYIEKKLSEDELKGGNNTDVFVLKLLKAQGNVLMAVKDIKEQAPRLYERYFRAMYE